MRKGELHHNEIRAQRQMKLLKKRNKGRCRKNGRHPLDRIEYQLNYIRKNTIYLNAPKQLSLCENNGETLAFFDDAITAIKNAKFNQILYFNLEAVEVVTADAIMYLIALINNVKRVKVLKIKCRGNLPKNDNAKQFIENSGFYSYVRGISNISCAPQNNIRIEHGSKTNTRLDERICDFVNLHAGVSTLQLTKRLYRMIIELMANTGQHAYSDLNIMNNNWYMYVEQHLDYIEFVFLDTGIGIPVTIRKNFVEVIKTKFLNIDSDSRFITSALQGEFRTETKKNYRGKGLPGIYEDSCEGFIKDMTIISGRGYCLIGQEGRIIETKLDREFQGTLYRWKFDYKNYKENDLC